MKHSLRFISVVMIAFFSLAFFSCSKDQLSPNGNTPIPTGTGGTNGITVNQGPVALAPVLVKHGPVSLTYTPLRELASATFSPEYKTVYSIVNQRGFLTHLLQSYYNGAEDYRYKYALNSNGLATGIKCEKINYSGEWQLYWERDFDYNASKQMTHINDGTAHYDFVYDANGDVTSIKFINWKGDLVHETSFWYSLNGSALLDDKNRLNPDVFGIDPYLKIFGRFMKHLPRRIKYSNYLANGTTTDFTYEYTLDAGGYIKTESKYYTGFHFLAETKTYEYQ